jgi:hypothetical protein
MDLINAKGQPRYGWLRESVERINYRNFDLRSVMDRKRSRIARYWVFNQFQFVGLTGPDWVAGLAVVDLRWLATAFAYCTTDGQVSLRFQPEGCHSERINAGLVASNFRQFFGTFDGELRRANGEIIQVRELTGFMEDHYARW